MFSLSLLLYLFIGFLFAADVITSRELLQASLNELERQQLDAVYRVYNSTYVDQFLHSRRLLEEYLTMEQFNDVGNHAWRNIEEIDGVRNKEIASIIFTTSSQGQSYLWERIIPSSITWMKYFANKFVVIEDSILMRFALRHCHNHETLNYSSFQCNGEATYILSRTCNDQYYGADGPCCKVDVAFDYLINESPKLFKNIKYVVHSDDDLYWRVDQLMRFISYIESSGINHLPIVANPYHWALNPLDREGVIFVENCKEIVASGWMQPMLLNRAALKRMAIPSAAYGLRDTCRAFYLTHDAGFEVYAWLLQLYHIQFPTGGINILNKIKYFILDILI
jgi:hypothetical protein